MRIVKTFRYRFRLTANPAVEECPMHTIYRSQINEYYTTSTGRSIMPVITDFDVKKHQEELLKGGWEIESKYYVDPTGKNREIA